MEIIFPDWLGPHPFAPDPRPTVLLPYPRPLPDLAPGQRVVLDSGAFGRSFRPVEQRQPLAEWMHDLAAWYQTARERYGDTLRWCVAPDVFGDPHQTYMQWKQWQAYHVPAAPVVQLCPHNTRDLFTIQRQACAYGPQSHVMLSNPARMTAARWGTMLGDACALIRAACGETCHIHLLGAGWSIPDIRSYHAVSGLDSIDSITYYLAAQRNERWCPCCSSATPWHEAAYHHASVALERGSYARS